MARVVHPALRVEQHVAELSSVRDVDVTSFERVIAASAFAAVAARVGAVSRGGLGMGGGVF